MTRGVVFENFSSRLSARHQPVVQAQILVVQGLLYGNSSEKVPDFGSESGPNQVKIGSKSGPGEGRPRGFSLEG